MNLSTTAQNDTATLLAKWVQENAAGYGAVATEVGQAGYPDAAIVSIVKDGRTASTAKVAVQRNRIVYVSLLGARIARPAASEDAGPIVGGFLAREEN